MHAYIYPYIFPGRGPRVDPERDRGRIELDAGLGLGANIGGARCPGSPGFAGSTMVKRKAAGPLNGRLSNDDEDVVDTRQNEI